MCDNNNLVIFDRHVFRDLRARATRMNHCHRISTIRWNDQRKRIYKIQHLSESLVWWVNESVDIYEVLITSYNSKLNHGARSPNAYIPLPLQGASQVWSIIIQI